MSEEKKYYLTKEGIGKIKKEYKTLESLRLAKTKGDTPDIWESEDLNPEYLSFREDLDLLESKISELENVLKNAQLVKKPSKTKREEVSLGATVEVEVEGQKDNFTILGTLEADPMAGRISNESPVGKALLGHKVGETVEVSSPTKVIYKIKKIKYKEV